jgi:phosphatidylserine decarboxylase
MLKLFNEFLYQAPGYATEKDWGGLIAFPFNVVINWPMTTTAGVALFTSHKVNVMLKKMFDVWAVFLTGKYLNTFSTQIKACSPRTHSTRTRSRSLRIMTRQSKSISKRLLSATRARNISALNLGTISSSGILGSIFDQWRIMTTMMLSLAPANPMSIALPIMFKKWISSGLKGYPTLSIICDGDPDYAKSFKGGTVFQAFLSARSYHRWHSPVKGTIKKIVFVSGTYYTANPNIQDDPTNPNHTSLNLPLTFLFSLKLITRRSG